MIEVSSPYICCGGTVATIDTESFFSRDRFFTVFLATETSDCQVFGHGWGRPVVPEVKAINPMCVCGTIGFLGEAPDGRGISEMEKEGKVSAVSDRSVRQ